MRMRFKAVLAAACALVFTGLVVPAGPVAASSGKSPIGLVQIASGLPDDLAGVSAGIKALNAAGGVDGRKVVLTVCQGTDDNSAAQCARNAVNNPNVVALMNSDTQGSSVDPLIQAAKMASIGTHANGEADLTSPNTFPIVGNDFSIVGGAVAAVKLLHDTKISCLYIAGDDAVTSLLNGALAPLHVQLTASVSVPTTGADLSPQVEASVANGTQAVVLAEVRDTAAQLVRTAQQLGTSAAMIIPGDVFDARSIAADMPGAKNVYVVSSAKETGPGWTQFTKDMAKYNPSYKILDGNVLQGWLAVQLFKYAVEHTKKLTRANLLKTLSSITAWNDLGLTPPLNFTTPQTALSGGVPREFNTTVTFSKFVNGKLVPLEKGAFISDFPSS